MDRRLRIVAADDEPDLRDFFVKVLSLLGDEVLAAAEDGADLVAKWCHLTPDLIITDVAMPEFDGVEAIGEISRDRHVPAIIVSAHHDDELVQRALREQVQAYLVKPIKAADLQPAIALVMQRNREIQALQQRRQHVGRPDARLEDQQVYP